MIRALPADGIAVLNADDERVRAMADLSAGSVVLFGESVDADVRAEAVELDHLARPSFRVSTPWGSADVTLSVSGRHMVTNALAALATAGSVDVDIGAAAAGVSSASLSASRMAVHRLRSGAVLIDDAYNANPASMRAALDALAAVPAERRIAVLGLMAEITDAPAAHRGILAYATNLGLDVISAGTDLYGIPPADDPLAALGALGAGTVVLVKASRVAQLDRIAAALIAASG